MNQKVLTVTTRNESLRSEAIGWSLEDSNNVGPDQVFMSHDHIGMIRSHDLKDKFCYPTILQALGDGWKLLCAPERIEDIRSDYGETWTEISYYWWLVKD